MRTPDRPDTDARDEGFLSRWSRRKVERRSGAEPTVIEPAAPTAPAAPTRAAAAVATPAAMPAAANVPPASPPPRESEPPPTLDEAAALTPQSDFTRFVRTDVDPGVRNTALKKLFADPHFNAMDGLDVYIDDYGRPDPLPASMLAKMAQRAFLNLAPPDEPQPPHGTATTAVAAADPLPPPAAAPLAEPGPRPSPDDEDPALRLQPDDAAGPGGPGPGPDADAGRHA